MLPEIPESLERNGTQSSLHAVRGSLSRPSPGIERFQNDRRKPRAVLNDEAIGRGILNRPQLERFSLGGRAESNKVEAVPSSAHFHSDANEDKI